MHAGSPAIAPDMGGPPPPHAGRNPHSKPVHDTAMARAEGGVSKRSSMASALSHQQHRQNMPVTGGRIPSGPEVS